MNSYFSKAIENLIEWIKIKSVKSEPFPNAPFGENVLKMLKKALQDGEKLGFKSVNYDGYIGEIIFGEGDDESALAILCHLDVVPEGDLNAWKFNPYGAVIENGVLYGRGVVDDKAPAILCLYALKELKDGGFVPNRKIKLILGCDEESGWGCIEHYKKVAVMPKEGFSPDGDFPVLYAEKGILHIEYAFDIDKSVKAFNGGERVNVVCDKACVEFYKKPNFKVSEEFTTAENKIFAYGKTAHGSTPEKGDNAIKKLLKLLADNGLFSKKSYCALFEDFYGLMKICDQTGTLTFSPNVINLENGKLKIKVDVRYPSTKNREEIIKELKKVGGFTILHEQNPLYSDKNGKLVKTLLDVYENYTLKKCEPQTTGGGTYARALENGVAFGPSEKGEDKCHMPNESMSIKDLEKCYEIYKQAIKKLCE